ncbi:Orange carotenoid protein, N-terminal domain protein [Synechococcus sp. PCC 7335]|uniref:orange carotenoid protein N-terminal domain-containing protein n=1 Tax=Synechococcus sp. (strain ATCC 29403 / PCC 7335) TaxID=91464 RepID=UPI00017EE027|nr:orange carotenoid protein N-terminal domain-containing protein [Synechococcus sp. PCC 7335]EDX84507.1 Orange carotenoid protein, N-terminal domain protein [Synechococcus sp. PCC 7335]
MATAADYTTSQKEQKQRFDALSADEKLATLWYVYEGLGEERLENPDDNKESDSSSDLYNQIKEKSKEEQLQFMRDVLSGEGNDLTNAYNNLSNTTKIALWYRLGQGMAKGSVIQVPGDYSLSNDAQQLVSAINEMSFEQSYLFVRDAIVG